MHAYKRATQSPRDANFALPSDELLIAVTFKRADGAEGPTKFSPPLSLSSAAQFRPNPLAVDQAIHHLSRLGFRPTRRATLTVSIRGTRALFERTFGTQLTEVRLDPGIDYAFQSLYYPPQGATWSIPSELAEVIDDAYIQWPHIYMGARKVASRAAKPAK